MTKTSLSTGLQQHKATNSYHQSGLIANQHNSTQPITTIGTTYPTDYLLYPSVGLDKKEKRYYIMVEETNNYNFICDFEPIIFRDIDKFTLQDVDYSLDWNSIKLSYITNTTEVMKVEIINEDEIRTTTINFSLNDEFNTEKFCIAQLNIFKKEFLSKLPRPTKCKNCVFMMNSELEKYCNKNFKNLKIN